MDAYVEALEHFSSRDPFEMAESSGTLFEPLTARFTVSYCSMDIRVSYPEGSFDAPGLSDAEKVVIIQYLAEAKGIPLKGRWISFLELPGGDSHDALFRFEAIQPLAVTFGDNLDGFRTAYGKLGGRPSEFGDASAVLPVLPRFPIAVVVWAANEEFGPNATMLFDASAPFYLTMAATYILGIEVSRRLIAPADPSEEGRALHD